MFPFNKKAYKLGQIKMLRCSPPSSTYFHNKKNIAGITYTGILFAFIFNYANFFCVKRWALIQVVSRNSNQCNEFANALFEIAKIFTEVYKEPTMLQHFFVVNFSLFVFANNGKMKILHL